MSGLSRGFLKTCSRRSNSSFRAANSFSAAAFSDNISSRNLLKRACCSRVYCSTRSRSALICSNIAGGEKVPDLRTSLTGISTGVSSMVLGWEEGLLTGMGSPEQVAQQALMASTNLRRISRKSQSPEKQIPTTKFPTAPGCVLDSRDYNHKNGEPSRVSDRVCSNSTTQI